MRSERNSPLRAIVCASSRLGWVSREVELSGLRPEIRKNLSEEADLAVGCGLLLRVEREIFGTLFVTFNQRLLLRLFVFKASRGALVTSRIGLVALLSTKLDGKDARQIRSGGRWLDHRDGQNADDWADSHPCSPLLSAGGIGGIGGLFN